MQNSLFLCMHCFLFFAARNTKVKGYKELCFRWVKLSVKIIKMIPCSYCLCFSYVLLRAPLFLPLLLLAVYCVNSLSWLSQPFNQSSFDLHVASSPRGDTVFARWRTVREPPRCVNSHNPSPCVGGKLQKQTPTRDHKLAFSWLRV